MIKQKVFNKVIQNFKENPRLARRTLSDKRMSQIEKVIIENYLLYRLGKSEEALKALEGYTRQGDPFILAHYDLLRGLLLCNLNDFDEARKDLEKAYFYFQRHDLNYFSFVALVNLFIIHLNKKDSEQMKKSIIKLQGLPLIEPGHQARVLILLFSYYSFMEMDEEAEDILEEIQLLKDAIYESDLSIHLVHLYAHSVRKEDFVKSREALEQMKNLRVYHSSANFNYMKKLLDHYESGDPIYITDSHFTSFPHLFHEIKVIQSLEMRDRDLAMEHWSWLNKRYPQIYLENFEYQGDKNIFSLCLSKYALKACDDEPVFPKGIGQMEKLQIIFENRSSPITQEKLFFYLWNRMPEDKDDLKRLSKTVSRFKDKFQIVIKARKGCYHIEHTPKKQVS